MQAGKIIQARRSAGNQELKRKQVTAACTNLHKQQCPRASSYSCMHESAQAAVSEGLSCHLMATLKRMDDDFTMSILVMHFFPCGLMMKET